ncbi:LLM class flavin-dependent oxidoreductase [Streptomyces sp. NPDC055105]|uniref:LLM class flavin-dependent oxidoreductase n=1 Tax=Streptomyces sp. NPDC055105 TaxID=3365719 RepID=UPI0037CD7C4E
MDFSLYLNPQTPGPEHDARIIRDTIETVEFADRNGFRSICLTEHHFSNYNTYADPFLFGSHLAARLQQAWVVLTVATLPLHHPMRFAEQVNLLDQLSGGRLVVGIGSGGSSIEFDGIGRPLDTRHAALSRHLDLTRQAWAMRMGDPPLDWSTPDDAGTVHARIMPAPLTDGGPLLARACLSEESTVAAGKEGLALFMGRFGPEPAARQLRTYTEALTGAGYDDEHVRRCLDWTGLAKMIYVADDDATARAEVEPLVESYIEAANYSRSADRAEAGAAQAARPGADKNAEKSSDMVHRMDDYLERAVIYGGPERVAEQLAAYERIGLGHLMLWFSWGFMDQATVMGSMQRFVDKVVPAYRELTRDRS